MKIAVVYNNKSKRVINKFGMQNKEKYSLSTIKRITDALSAGGHDVVALEGDKDLVSNLEKHMPTSLNARHSGMIFNLAYGLQGEARYTHVPAILEMVGLPYIGSGPLAHSLALDKVVAKMIMRQSDIPTPDFAVLESPDFESPELEYPLIVKPKSEAVSFGIKIVQNEEELREAAGTIFDAFDQPVLVEQYIAGREINVAVIGNNSDARALPPVEISFGDEGPAIYTYEDKKGLAKRTISSACPAPISEDLTKRSQEIALKVFKLLGCYDCARVDMRIDEQGRLYVLEINSLPSLTENASLVRAAQTAGMNFPALINNLVDVAHKRYFGCAASIDLFINPEAA